MVQHHIATALLLLLFISKSAHASTTTRRQCCEPPTAVTLTDAEVAQFEQCICLRDNVEQPDQILSAGQFGFYHWRVTDFSLIDFDDDTRPEVEFRLSPCDGEGDLYVNPLRTPWPSNETSRWNASYPGEEARLSVQIFHADYYVTVHAVSDFVFSLSAITKPETVTAEPGGNGELEVVQTGGGSLNVSWISSPTPGSQYQLYFVERGLGLSAPCSNASTPNVNCIMRTGCGLRTAGVPVRNRFVDLPESTNVSMAASNLKEDTEYFFNVALLSPSGLVTAYLGTVGTLTLNKISVAAPASTTMILITSVGCVLIALLVAVILIKNHMDAVKVRKVQMAREAKTAKLAKKEKTT